MNRTLRDFPVELPAALLAAAAVAFWAWILPSWRLEQAVGATGLGAILPAARPPLGDTARALMALAGGGLAFALVWAGLKSLDRKEPLPEGFPQFRKADLHPDAPKRRPILAGEEFGAPRTTEASAPVPDTPPDGRHEAPPEYLLSDPLDDEADRRQAHGPTDAHAPAEIAEIARAVEESPTPKATGEHSVGELMARLERGLAARGGVPVRPVANEDTEQALRAIAAELREVAGGR